MAVLKKLGWDKDLTAEEMAVITQDRRQQCRRGELGDRPVGRHPARLSRSRRHALRQRQGAGQCLEPARSGAGASRADLHAAPRPRRQIPDAARRAAVPHAQYRLHGAEGGGRRNIAQGLPDHPHLGPPRRIRGRRRGDALQPVARRAAAGHVRRDQHRRMRPSAASRTAQWVWVSGAENGARPRSRRW